MELEALKKMVAAVARASDPKVVNGLIAARFKNVQGSANISAFLDQIESQSSVAAVFHGLNIDEIQRFLKNVSSGLRTHPKVASVGEVAAQDEAMAGAGTTSADVGAFPVPLGQVSPARKKKKHEGLQRLMGIGSYQIDLNEAVPSAEEEILQLIGES